MSKVDLMENLQYLQDLKFEIFIHSNLDYHQIKVDVIEISDQSIDLIDYIHRYKQSKSVVEIAGIIRDQYNIKSR